MRYGCLIEVVIKADSQKDADEQAFRLSIELQTKPFPNINVIEAQAQPCEELLDEIKSS